MSLDEERLLILQMVADKKISAEEAAELLRALDDARGGGGAQAEPGASAFVDRGLRDAEQTVREAAQTIAENARRMAQDAAEATRPEKVGGLFDRFMDMFDFGDTGKIHFEEVLEGAFTTDRPALNLHTGNGKIHLHGWDQPGYKAILRYQVRGARDEAEARERVRDRVTVEASGDRLHLRGNDRWYLERGITVNAELWVPRDRRYQLHARTGNGALHVLDLSLTEGEMTSGNGAIRVERVVADYLKMGTGNGSITLEADVGECKATTGNGSLRFRPTGTGGRQVSLSTGNGSARLDLSALAKSQGFRLEGTTGMGSINVNLTDNVIERQTKSFGHKHLVAHSRNYAEAAERLEIRVTTGMGSITVE